jgi:hypothetical protein
MPTWDKMRKRCLESSGWNSLYNDGKKLVTHLFLKISLAKEIWVECTKTLNQGCIWQGQSMEDAWRTWVSNPQTYNIKTLIPLKLGKNVTMFHDKSSIP